MLRDVTFRSGSLELAGHLAAGPTAGPRPGVVVIHDYPSGPSGLIGATAALPELCERIADSMGFLAFAPRLRGLEGSDGEFSIKGWKADVHAAVAHLRANHRLTGVLLAGFGVGGSLAICAGADDLDIAGVAAAGASADFDPWAANPRRLYLHARSFDLVPERAESQVFDTWSREMRLTKAIDAAARLRPRPLLLLHGSDDEIVPDLDARAIADAHTGADLRILDGAGHALRHDPRAMAILLGWLDRQHQAATVRR